MNRRSYSNWSHFFVPDSIKDIFLSWCVNGFWSFWSQPQVNTLWTAAFCTSACLISDGWRLHSQGVMTQCQDYFVFQPIPYFLQSKGCTSALGPWWNRQKYTICNLLGTQMQRCAALMDHIYRSKDAITGASINFISSHTCFTSAPPFLVLNKF